MTGAECPRCGWPLDGPDELEALRALAEDLGIVVVDGTVSSTDAARLLGLSEKTMRNMRSEMRGPEYVKRGGRVRYPLENLASIVPALSLET